MSREASAQRSLNPAAQLATLGALFALCGCGDKTQSPVTAPGGEERAETRALEAGAAMLQAKEPLDALNAYLNGFHFYNGAMSEQMEAHHFCGHLNQDVIQCVIFDGDGADAKLMGVEYIVSRAIFETLPQDEKHLWHSHSYEVRSGTLIAPGVPDAAEHELMEQLVGTYGKTWHTWHTDREMQLPVGAPRLMMGFTADGQANPEMVRRRDERLNASSEQKRAKRADIDNPPIDPDANAWEKGVVMQVRTEPVQAK